LTITGHAQNAAIAAGTIALFRNFTVRGGASAATTDAADSTSIMAPAAGNEQTDRGAKCIKLAPAELMLVHISISTGVGEEL
jgi:hypothetical protein